MSRKLIICNTHFQVIVAIQLKLTIFKHDDVDIHVSDHSINADKVSDNLRKTGLFHEVNFVKSKKEIASGTVAKVFQFMNVCIGKKRHPAYQDYDEVLFYNLNMPVYQLMDSAAESSKRTSFSGMEEGVLSYEKMSYGKSPRLVDGIRRFTRHPQILKELKRYYCFLPQLFDKTTKNYELVQVPSIQSDLELLRQTLCDVFEYESHRIEYPYVFFASSSDVDGKGFGETDLVLQLAEVLGKDAILVKMHPRDNRDIYRSAGIAVMERSDVPWEVCQICGDADSSICMTVTSGSFLNAAALLGDRTKGVFLVPSSAANSPYLKTRIAHIANTVTRLHKTGICRFVCMAQIEEIEHLFDSLNTTSRIVEGRCE